ncbi:MAG: type IV pilus modification protein PilV [Methylotenera sp.]
MNRYLIPSQSMQKGMVLLEALIAVVIFSMGILAIAGLQAAMVKNTSDAKYRSDAAFIAQQALGRMWADPDNLVDYVEDPATDIPTLLPNGKRTVLMPSVGEISVIVTWQLPGQEEHNFTTNARIAGGD